MSDGCCAPDLDCACELRWPTRRRSTARSPSSIAASARLRSRPRTPRQHGAIGMIGNVEQPARHRRSDAEHVRHGSDDHHSDASRVTQNDGDGDARPSCSRRTVNAHAPAAAASRDRQLGALADGRGRAPAARCATCGTRPATPTPARSPTPAVLLRDRRQRRRALQLRCSEPRLRAARRRRHLQQP